MTDEKRERIAALSSALFDARRRYEAMAMMNTNIEPEAARRQSIQFNLARAEMFEAQAALDDAITP